MTDRLLNDDIARQVREAFDQQLRHPVQVLFFGSQDGCDYCDDTLQLVQEVVELSDLVELKIYDLEKDNELARQYHVDRAPGLVIAAKDGEQVVDHGVRFAGIPSGYEFSSLIQAVVLVSSRDSGLQEKTRQALKALSEPVHMLVFTTPTCPYCPRAVVLAFQMALESPMVQAEMVEATEFPELSNQFSVSGVPQTTINLGAGTVIGAYPEEQLLEEIQLAMQPA